MKRFFIIIAFLLISWGVGAQDTITVMQYNLLQYGNYNSGFADCYETNNNTQRKDECIRTLLDYVKPDIFTVCEFGKPQQLQSDFLKHNLNTNGIDYWKSDNIVNYANSSIINHIFYDSRKMELKKHVALRTSPRDTDVYELYLKTSSLLSGDTIKLVCIVAHPKAGMNYEADRRATMQTAMDYINQHYQNDNVLIMGDFNMYRASESGYRLLTQTYSNSNVLFVDPLANQGGVGEWNSNSSFAPFHTQSTRRWSDECFSSGGLDDRFDFILMSDEIYMGFNKLKYVNNSYFAVGNDGRHFDQSINQNGNSAVPDIVAEALFDGSDHLPVTMKMKVYGNWDVEEMALDAMRVYPNPTDGIIHIETGRATSQQEFRITNVMGQVLMKGQIAQTIDVSGLPAGIYFIQIDGITRKFVKN
ncbi:MAG: T9SS type A sorting domain-containing protein [Bacteroidales bacterium]|nr:T9SS type A sorting domain-containing protein [Bacteroidales bacterium]